MHLAALFITNRHVVPPPVTAPKGTASPTCIATFAEAAVWRIRFTLPADRASLYDWNGESYAVASDMSGDLRAAFVSCNGEEVGDLDRDGSERNVMWARMRDDHGRQPLSLLLHGGDQIYADEITKDHRLCAGWPKDLPRNPSADALADLRHHLRQRLFERYAQIYAAPPFAWLAARVPSLMQWDDHDICDGWGSLPAAVTASPVGQTLFATAREAFLIFQHAATDGDLPARFADPAGQHLGWSVAAGGMRILAPDLRSERTRHTIMGPGGWAMIDTAGRQDAAGHTLLMSSVPLLGPRLSLLELGMRIVPRMQKYEDDLRDQWQSRAHRDEWCRMLRLVRDMARRDGQDLTALSGEIHLATRAVMDLGGGLHLNQLVASGIAHRAPPAAWARFLGALATIGDAPLPDHPIRIVALPGHRTRYLAERNYLLLTRADRAWSARWNLEKSGLTPPLPL
ncbi:alkaline phosphatase D family protein [Loktanella sp. DJP18]|uniref:alkaline phosphatase D family protein n=1 Tax=Loktanella sp. DJP18 TaxID=3409788 RepID=UPI003BB4D65C